MKPQQICLRVSACISALVITVMAATQADAAANKQASSVLDAAVLNPNSLYLNEDKQTDFRNYNLQNKHAHISSHRARRKRHAASQEAKIQLIDACQSKMEVLTPYYATNSKGQLRTVVNSGLMQQAIQVETCSR